MKWVVAALLFAGNSARANPDNVLLADVGLHVVGVGYQRTVGQHLALQLAAESYTPWTQEDTFFEVQGFVVRARPMIYSNEAPRGWWLSPFGQLGIGTADRGTGTLWAAGVSVGYAWLVWDHLHVAIGGGIQYARARIEGGSGRPAFAEVWPQIDGSVGYAF